MRFQEAPIRQAALLLVFMLVLTGLALAAYDRLNTYYLGRAAERGQATMRLTALGLEAALSRFEPIPALIANRRNLVALLSAPQDDALQLSVNEDLKQIAQTINASDVYLMDTEGWTLAASNFDAVSFVGRRFAYRPYFTEARDGDLGRFFALGVTSLRRGYFYAAPVRDRGQIVGVLAVKFEVQAFESAWRAAGAEVLVTDPDGIAFMASRPEWLFTSFDPLTPERRQRIEANRRYPLYEVRALQASRTTSREGLELRTVSDVARPPVSFVVNKTEIEEAGWTVMVFVPTAEARQQALGILAASSPIVAFILAVIVMLLGRPARLAKRLETQRAARAELERRVVARTADLNAANSALRGEVDERRLVETRLRATQDELIQAGKLAALGQMSAALSHELNQPLAAIKSYSDNAATFIDRGRTADARDNLVRISSMVDRMAAISHHLRNFARAPGTRVGPIPLVAVLEDALALMAPPAKAIGASIEFEPPGEEIFVVGGRVRLQQIIVNLINNALDASDKDAPRVTVHIVPAGERVKVEVRDFGPGVDEAVAGRLFDPFFTTKAPGEGLGLGLSISYNIVQDFGGALSARNHPEGGAVFTVELSLAEAPGLAAAE